MNPVIRFDQVSFGIGGRAILSHVTFDVERGETLVLLGRSGSGKTTSLRLINALLTPSGGTVVVEGRATRDWDLIRLRRSIGYVIQDIGLFPHFTIERNVGLVPELEGWPVERRRSRAEELLRMVDLAPADFAPRYPRQLSGGQKQRVGLARALAADPPILLLDEPFGALDPITRGELQQKFLELCRAFNKTAVFVTHDIEEARRIGTRIAVFEDGTLKHLVASAAFDPQVHR
jgi:osmoprotectant transport system ATP-binding protein